MLIIYFLALSYYTLQQRSGKKLLCKIDMPINDIQKGKQYTTLLLSKIIIWILKHK